MNSQIDNIMFIVNRYALAVVFCFIIICFAMGSYVMGGGRPSIEESSREDGKNFLGAILGCGLPFALKIIFTGAPKGDPCIFYISIALIIIAIICNGAISGRIRTNGDTAFDRNNAKHFVPAVAAGVPISFFCRFPTVVLLCKFIFGTDFNCKASGQASIIFSGKN